MSICVYCGLVDSALAIRKHIWEQHKNKEINNVITKIDVFILTIANRFICRYNLSAELSDIAQYLRENLFIILRDTYKPSVGNSEHFAKAVCNNFLKRFLQEYYYKHNRVHRGFKTYIESTDADAYDYESPSFFITDPQTTHPLDDIVGIELNAHIYNMLTPIEQEIFKYITDDVKSFTQKEIANALEISQPLVSYKIRTIRKKTTRLLNIIDSD